MLRIKPLFILCAALLTVTPAASADVNSDMNQFFNKLGFASNTTQPGVWQGQAAGYAYGGSLYARTQVKNVQLISMTLPDINAGCGGIDAYLGSFSFINGEQLQRFVKQIMSNAAGYFFDLALQTTVPEIKTAKDFLQKMASDINSMNLSSCQAAQGIIGGLFPRTQVSQQKVCQDIAGESNIFADWAASRQGCEPPRDQTEYDPLIGCYIPTDITFTPALFAALDVSEDAVAAARRSRVEWENRQRKKQGLDTLGMDELIAKAWRFVRERFRSYQTELKSRGIKRARARRDANRERQDIVTLVKRQLTREISEGRFTANGETVKREVERRVKERMILSRNRNYSRLATASP